MNHELFYAENFGYKLYGRGGGEAYLYELDNLAGDEAHVPCFCDILQCSRNETEDDDEEVSDGEVDDEDVGHTAHVQVARNGVADENVANHTHDEDDGVEVEDGHFELGRCDVIVNPIQIFRLLFTVVIQANKKRADDVRVVRRHDVTARIQRRRFNSAV